MDEEVDGKSGLAGFTGEGKVWSNRSRHRTRGCLASEPAPDTGIQCRRQDVDFRPPVDPYSRQSELTRKDEQEHLVSPHAAEEDTICDTRLN